MGKNKVLVKVHPEGKYVVDLDKNINMADVSANFPTPVHFHYASCTAHTAECLHRLQMNMWLLA